MIQPIKLMEVWKDVTENDIPWVRPNSYKVSTFGQIYSYLSDQLIFGRVDLQGYHTVGLRTKDPNF